MRSVYLDTTIPSYYVDERPGLRLHVRRTRDWWDQERLHYLVYTSGVTLRELSEVPFPRQSDALGLLEKVPLLEAADEIASVVDIYLAHRLMPTEDVRDAFHLAFASCYKMDFPLTWNCRHLANANKRRHIEIINSRIGLISPDIVTPLQLVWSEEEDES
ncbi:MAG: type II toxin-antitoxin system VapC family toxin [Candidatus Riflebacteria bacterium]|nr:type II toxin-antitoxin system VapC family toxin [Candidatus Riflebacteria bacterium]